MPKPFVIFALRRSGGTAMTEFMRAVADVPAVLQEPFNTDRVWGAVTRRFMTDWDRPAMTQAVKGLLRDRPCLKHCPEILPPLLTRAVIDACAELGYAIVLLQRGDEKARLRSLYRAMATGAWGAEEAAERYPLIRAGTLSPLPVVLSQIEAHSRADTGALGQVLLRLRAKGLDFGWHLFEDIYRDRASGAGVLRQIARRLGRDMAEDDPAIAGFLDRPGQPAAGIEDFLPGAPRILAWLDRTYD